MPKETRVRTLMDSPVNVLKGPRHCLNLRGSNFVGFLDNFEKEST